MFGQGFHAHVVDDEQFGLEVAVENLILFVGVGASGVEVPHEVEDAPVIRFVPVPDGFFAEGLSEVAFAHAGGADEQDVACLGDELAAGQLVDADAGDAGVEAEVKVAERAGFAEGGGFGVAGDGFALPSVEFVL